MCDPVGLRRLPDHGLPRLVCDGRDHVLLTTTRQNGETRRGRARRVYIR